MLIDAADPTTWTDADRAVAAWAIGALREGRGGLDTHQRELAEPLRHERSGHLRKCASLRVTSFEGSDGTHGCDTGCDYWRLEGRVACDHDADGAEFWVGDFGELEYWLEDLNESLAHRSRSDG